MCGHHGPRDSTAGAMVSKGHFWIEEEKRVPYLVAEGRDCFWLKFVHGGCSAERRMSLHEPAVSFRLGCAIFGIAMVHGKYKGRLDVVKLR